MSFIIKEACQKAILYIMSEFSAHKTFVTIPSVLEHQHWGFTEKIGDDRIRL